MNLEKSQPFRWLSYGGVTPHKSASSRKNVESRLSQTICCFPTITQHKNALLDPGSV